MSHKQQAYLDALGISTWAHRQQQQTPQKPSLSASANTKITETVADISPPSSAIKLIPWESLQKQVQNCHACQLAEGRTQTVFGVGDVKADWMIIGEAPGRDEDIQGKPFVGRAGQLLNAMLQAIDLEREQVFIANVLKCRPPQNRDPSTIEIEQCSTYLSAQIQHIQPKVILVVGRIAAHFLLDTTIAVGKLRSKVHHYKGIPLIVTYHPAYLLRRPSEKRKSWEDLKLALETVEQS